MRRFFVKRQKLLAATSNLRVEQNLVHLDRFLHFSQIVFGVTLNVNIDSCSLRVLRIIKIHAKIKLKIFEFSLPSVKI